MEILILLLMFVLNGIFAMSEIAVVSARKARLSKWIEEGDEKAKPALDLARDPGNFLSTVQIGITMVGIFSGAFGGTRLSRGLATQLAEWGVSAAYAEALALGIVVVGITYGSLIIGELVPKRLGLHNPERIAVYVARPMMVLSRFTFPLVRLLSASTELVLKLLGSRPSSEAHVTEEEIEVMMAEGAAAGVFEKSEHEMVKNVFRLDERAIGSLLTPRMEIVYLDLDSTPDENRRKILESPFARFPVCRGGWENVVGVVRSKDLLVQALTGQPFNIAAVMQEPLFVPDSLYGMQLLELFKDSKQHLALVVDEYGDIKGQVTLNDVLDALVGEMPRGPEGEALFVRRDDGSWLIDGMMPVDELKDLLKIKALPDEEEDSYNTLGGFVMMSIGRVPVTSDRFEWNDFSFEVVDMDGNRVDKVLVTPPRVYATPP